jgi:hypothetical protein
VLSQSRGDAHALTLSATTAAFVAPLLRDRGVRCERLSAMRAWG